MPAPIRPQEVTVTGVKKPVKNATTLAQPELAMVMTA